MGDGDMEIGIAVALGGVPGSKARIEPPDWTSIRDQALAAEDAGFDLLIAEDALSMEWGDETAGYWESASVLSAIAAVTNSLRLGHGVLNGPYRSPGLIAKIAKTIDEISGGRFFLGIGAGNSGDGDYRSFGIAADPRYSRFAETIEIVHRLLTDGVATFAGTYHRVDHAPMVLDGPRPDGPPIVVAAGGPRMMRLAARFGDGWNWWGGGPGFTSAAVRPLLDELDRACEEVGRDPASLRRTYDLYLPTTDDDLAFAEQTADTIRALGDVGISEVRCYLHPLVPDSRDTRRRPDLVAGMADVVRIVHAA